jgi:hypothetical protein
MTRALRIQSRPDAERAAGSSGRERVVVDQSRRADPRRDDGQDFAVDALHGRQRVFGDELEVVGLDI